MFFLAFVIRRRSECFSLSVSPLASLSLRGRGRPLSLCHFVTHPDADDGAGGLESFVYLPRQLTLLTRLELEAAYLPTNRCNCRPRKIRRPRAVKRKKMKEEQFWEIVEKPLLPKRPLQTADPRNNAYNLAHAPCSHVQSVQEAPTAPPLSHSPSLLFHPISAPSHLLLFLSCSGSRSPLQAPYHILHCNACSSCLHYYTRRAGKREGPREREAVPAFHTLRSSKFYRIEAAIRVDRPEVRSGPGIVSNCIRPDRCGQGTRDGY